MLRARTVLLSFVIAAALLSPGWAQVTTATILGTVTDESGAVLPGVSVTLTHLDTNSTRTAVSDDSGRYRVPELPLGRYEVKAELQGFQTFLRRGLELTLGQEALINVSMKVGEISEQVVVTGAAPLVETSTAQLAGLVDDKKIRDLPLNGRSFTELAILQPGVVPARAAGRNLIVGQGQKISVNGSRVNATSFILDGTDINDSMGQSPGSVNGFILGVETIREFTTLLQTFSAEYGRASGGVVSAVTKSGTNELHGSLFEFHRNSALDAKNFYDRADEAKPSFKRNQFGFVAAGPVVKNKTFFVGSYEAMRNRQGTTTPLIKVPNAQMRQGIIPVGGTPTNVGVNPAIRPYLDLYPLPNGVDNGDGTGNWNRVFKRVENENYFLAKIDHNFTESDSFLARYTYQEGTQLIPSSFNFPSVDLDQNTRAQYVTVEEKHIFSPNLLNVARFGFNRSSLSSDDLVNDSRFSDPRFAFEPGKPEIGDISITGMAIIGRSFNTPRIRFLNVFEYSDTLSLTRGRHSLKFGFNYKRYQQNHTQANNKRGTYAFANLRDFLENRPNNYSGALIGFDDYVRGDRQHLPSLFIQDDFRLRPGLTLNLGLRWEAATANREVNGKTSAINVVTDTRPHAQSPNYEVPLTNFAPRVGFAWDPSGAGKMSIRGGFGVFHQMVLEEVYLAARQLFPFVDIFSTTTGTTFPNPLLAPRSQAATAIESVDQVFKTPYMLQYNLNVQRQLIPNLALLVGYVGSRGINLPRYANPNTAIPDISPDGTLFFPATRNGVTTTRRFPAFTRIRLATNGSDSWYNALQVSLQKRFDRHYQVQVSYNYSKSLDTASGLAASDFGNTSELPMLYYDMRGQRSVSALHLSHTFSTNYTWEIPFGDGLTGVAAAVAKGWSINGILSLTSGTPVNIEIPDTLDNERDRTVGTESRPSLAAGRSNNPILGDPAKWFDGTAFELAPAGFYGNLGRLTGRGSRFTNVDFSLVKSTRVSEAVSLQFRAEFFNIPNHPNFSPPSGGNRQPFLGNRARNSTFGLVTSTANSSRQIQFGLKLVF